MKTKSKSKLELEQVVKTEQGKHVRKKEEVKKTRCQKNVSYTTKERRSFSGGQTYKLP